MSQFPHARPTKAVKVTTKAARPKAPKHVPRWSPDSDWRGRAFCDCGQPWMSPVHAVEPTSDEQRAEELRRIGEKQQ